jgi:hypothetical protein
MDKMSRRDWQLGGAALLLVIALLFFPWFSISVFGHTATAEATSGPDSFFAVLAVIIALALIADLVLERFFPQVQVPPIAGSRDNTRFILAIATAVCVALRFLLYIHFLGWGFYLSVIITAALVYAAVDIRRTGPLA